MQNTITYAVGDVHGRADLLEAVIAHALRDAEKVGAPARFAFIGDVCDRGFRSRQSFDLVAEIVSEFEGSFLVRGNHDDMYHKAVAGNDRRVTAAWIGRGGMQTLDSYLIGDPSGAIEIIRTLHNDHLRLVETAAQCVIEGGIVYSHAGIDPSSAVHSQDARDLMWIREPFLDHVGLLSHTVVHGHTVVGDLPVVTENRISIDTGAYKSGRLSVVAVSDEGFRFFQTDGRASRVIEIEPVCLDRGYGTVLDRSKRLADWKLAA